MLKRVMTGVGVNIFDKLSIATAQLLMVPLLAHAWGLKLYGLWVMLSTVPTFLAMGDLGFATAAGTRMTIANARGDRDRVILIFQSAWAAILLSSLVFTLLALAGAFLTPASVFGADLPLALPQLRLTLLVLLLYGILAVQGSIFYAGFRCAGLFALGNFLHSVMVILEAVFTFAAILGFAGTPLMVACCLFLSRAIGVTAQFTLMRRHVPWLPVSLARASLTEIRKLMAPAGTVMLLPISQACMLQGTALLLGLTAGEAAVPAFTAARTLSRVGQQMCWTVNAALMPEVSAAIGRRDLGAIAMMVFSTLAVSVVLIAPFALVFGVAGKSIILLWSRGIIHAPALMIAIMAVSILAQGFWFPLSNLILSADRQSTYTIPFVVLALLAMPVTYFLSPAMGSAAPALAMALSDVVMLVLVMALVQRHLVGLDKVLAAGPLARERLRGLAARVARR